MLCKYFAILAAEMSALNLIFGGAGYKDNLSRGAQSDGAAGKAEAVASGGAMVAKMCGMGRVNKYMILPNDTSEVLNLVDTDCGKYRGDHFLFHEETK
jgi:hypothetical protein